MLPAASSLALWFALGGVALSAPAVGANTLDLTSIGLLEPDDSQAEEAAALFAARIELQLRDIVAAAGADEAAVEALRKALTDRFDKASTMAEESLITRDRAWARSEISRYARSAEWGNALAEVLSAEQRAAIDTLAQDRDFELKSAQVTLSTAMLASELRLRGPQVDELEPLVKAWIADRTATRGQMMSSDVVEEVLDHAPIADWMSRSQLARCRRMRSAKQPSTPADGFPGDDMELGRGRFAEDDFLFDLDALTMLFGWGPETTGLLAKLGDTLGRESRRSGVKPVRAGKSALFKSIVKPSSFPRWNKLVEAAIDGTEGAAPDQGPAYGQDPSPFVEARIDLVIAAFVKRVSLREDQRAGLAAALRPYVAREYVARYRVFGGLDEETVWRELRFIDGKDPRRGAGSRKKICDALDKVLDEQQRTELGL